MSEEIKTETVLNKESTEVADTEEYLEDDNDELESNDVEAQAQIKNKIVPIDYSDDTEEEIGVRTEEEIGVRTEPEEINDFRARAKSFEPACGAIIKVIQSLPQEICRKRLRKLKIEESKIDDLVELLEMSDETRQAFKQALARIIARRTSNEEIIDWFIVCGATCELSIGYLSLSKEISKLEKSFAGS